MKRTKKLFALVLSAALALMLAVPVFAAETTYSYEIYQIFTGDYSNGVLSNVKWGQNAKIPAASADETQANVGDPVPDNVLNELTAVTPSHSDSEKLAVITKFANLDSTAYNATPEPDTNTGKYTYSNLPNGYYLVKDKDGSLGENGAYTTYVVQVVDGTLTIERKDDLPDVEKKIVETTTENGQETNTKLDTNEASIGDTINYEITGTLPSNFDEYKEYYYVFTDTLSKGLTYNSNSVKVEIVNGDTKTNVTNYFYKGNTEDNTTGATTITIGIQDLKALVLDDNNSATVFPVTINKDSKIVVTYSATLNQNAVIAGDGNTNDVVLAYSNNPNKSGDGATSPPPENPQNEPTKPDAYGETPKDTVTTYTTELTITKKADSENGDILPGAEFTLTGDGVNIVLVTEETFKEDENGDYYKLKNGTYTTTAPLEVYDSLDDKYSYNEETGEYTKDENGEYWKLKDDTYTKTAPTELYEDTSTTYTKTTNVVAKGKGQGEDGANTTVVDAVDPETGTVTFTGLGAGTYTITESKTPEGYNTIAPIEFTLTFNAQTLKFASDNKNVVVGETTNTLSTTIVNESGSTLPSTGGMGTRIFYIVGGVLVVGAGVLLVTKKRMKDQK